MPYSPDPVRTAFSGATPACNSLVRCRPVARQRYEEGNRHSTMEMMLSSFSRFFRLVYKTCLRSKATPARMTPKRFVLMGMLIPALFLGQCMHWLGFFLDDLLFRGYRKVRVKEPVFMVGMPRSGTTFLHRLLAKDNAHFSTFSYWEMAMAPSITERKIWFLVGKIDAVLGGFGRKLLVTVDKKAFQDVGKIHPISLFEPDEDEMLLIWASSSILLLLPFPFE